MLGPAGSPTVYIQANPPGDVERSNWLPSPDLRVVRHRCASLRMQCLAGRRSRGGGVKRLYQVAGDLRFADVASCS